MLPYMQGQDILMAHILKILRLNVMQPHTKKITKAIT